MAVGIVKPFKKVDVDHHDGEVSPIRLAAFKLARYRVNQKSLVVHIGQAVLGHHCVHRFVVLRFNGIARQKLEDMIADLYLCSVLQRLAGNGATVDKRSIGAVGVLDYESAIFRPDGRVLS